MSLTRADSGLDARTRLANEPPRKEGLTLPSADGVEIRLPRRRPLFAAHESATFFQDGVPAISFLLEVVVQEGVLSKTIGCPRLERRETPNYLAECGAGRSEVLSLLLCRLLAAMRPPFGSQTTPGTTAIKCASTS